MAIKNPTALLQALVQQHTKYVAEEIHARGLDVATIGALSHDEMLAVIDGIQARVEARWGSKAWTGQAITKSLVEAHGSVEAAYAFAVEKVNVWKGLTYQANVNGRRVTKDIETARAEFLDNLRRAERAIATMTDGPVEANDDPIEEPEQAPVRAPIEVKAPKQDNSLSLRKQLLTWIQRVQRWQADQEMPQWGYRQAINGRAMIEVGFPLEGIKDAFTMGWDDDARKTLGVIEFDTIAWGRSVAKPGESGLEAAVRILGIEAGLNVALFGGAGIGKTTVVEKMAEDRGIPCAVISCNPETAGVDLFGFLKPGTEPGYQLSEASLAMLEAEQGQEVWILLDEADAMETAMGLMWNRSLANKRLSHRFLARNVSLANVRFFAAQNTPGLGADEHFPGREPQDGSFRDRLTFIRVTRDEQVQEEILLA